MIGGGSCWISLLAGKCLEKWYERIDVGRSDYLFKLYPFPPQIQSSAHLLSGKVTLTQEGGSAEKRSSLRIRSDQSIDTQITCRLN